MRKFTSLFRSTTAEREEICVGDRKHLILIRFPRKGNSKIMTSQVEAAVSKAIRHYRQHAVQRVAENCE